MTADVRVVCCRCWKRKEHDDGCGALTKMRSYRWWSASRRNLTVFFPFLSPDDEEARDDTFVSTDRDCSFSTNRRYRHTTNNRSFGLCDFPFSSSAIVTQWASCTLSPKMPYTLCTSRRTPPVRGNYRLVAEIQSGEWIDGQQRYSRKSSTPRSGIFLGEWLVHGLNALCGTHCRLACCRYDAVQVRHEITTHGMCSD